MAMTELSNRATQNGRSLKRAASEVEALRDQLERIKTEGRRIQLGQKQQAAIRFPSVAHARAVCLFCGHPGLTLVRQVATQRRTAKALHGIRESRQQIDTEERTAQLALTELTR